MKGERYKESEITQSREGRRVYVGEIEIYMYVASERGKGVWKN